MSTEMQDKLGTLLKEVADSDKPYASLASSVQESLSAEREAITLPDSVLALMGSGNVPDLVCYTQQDLLSLLDSMARTIGYTLAAAQDDIADDGLLLEAITKYKTQFSRETDKVITDLGNVDVFAPLTPIQRLALALVLSDIAADRKLSLPPLWQTIIVTHGQLGEA